MALVVRLAFICAAVALVAATAVFVPSAGGAPAAADSAAPIATMSRACGLSRREGNGGLGVTYVLSLRVAHTSCRNGKRVVKAFHSCRHRHGRSGRCRSRVLRYSCSERRLNVIRTQFDGRVTCRRGRNRVVHTYTQYR